MSSHRVPQCSSGARGSAVWVGACLIVFPACHIHNGMKDDLSGETGEGGNRSSWSALGRAGFPLQRVKCFTFVWLYHNNNNKYAAFVTMLFLDPKSCRHCLPTFTEKCCCCRFSSSHSECVLAFCLRHNDLGPSCCLEN